jgi:hypothetical protein
MIIKNSRVPTDKATAVRLKIAIEVLILARSKNPDNCPGILFYRNESHPHPTYRELGSDISNIVKQINLSEWTPVFQKSFLLSCERLVDTI